MIKINFIIFNFLKVYERSLDFFFVGVLSSLCGVLVLILCIRLFFYNPQMYPEVVRRIGRHSNEDLIAWAILLMKIEKPLLMLFKFSINSIFWVIVLMKIQENFLVLNGFVISNIPKATISYMVLLLFIVVKYVPKGSKASQVYAWYELIPKEYSTYFPLLFAVPFIFVQTLPALLMYFEFAFFPIYACVWLNYLNTGRMTPAFFNAYILSAIFMVLFNIVLLCICGTLDIWKISVFEFSYIQQICIFYALFIYLRTKLGFLFLNNSTINQEINCYIPLLEYTYIILGLIKLLFISLLYNILLGHHLLVIVGIICFIYNLYWFINVCYLPRIKNCAIYLHHICLNSSLLFLLVYYPKSPLIWLLVASIDVLFNCWLIIFPKYMEKPTRGYLVKKKLKKATALLVFGTFLSILNVFTKLFFQIPQILATSSTILGICKEMFVPNIILLILSLSVFFYFTFLKFKSSFLENSRLPIWKIYFYYNINNIIDYIKNNTINYIINNIVESIIMYIIMCIIMYITSIWNFLKFIIFKQTLIKKNKKKKINRKMKTK